jgi:hypothetical protein
MPTFEIPDGPTTVDLQGTGDEKNPGPATGSIVFNVTNKSAESAEGSLSVQVAGATKKEWFKIDGDLVRTFGAGETQTAKIDISLSKDIAPGDYPFRLRAAAENDPDNDFAEGPVSVAKKKEAAVVGRKSLWWLWLIIALLVLIALGVGGYFLFKPGPTPEPTPEPAPTNKVATSDTAAVPDFTTTAQTVEQAKANAGGFDVAEFPGEATGKPPRTIISQNPQAGATQPKGSLVKVTFDPGVPVPQLPNNATFVSAQNALQDAHLTPGRFLCDRGSGPNAPIGRVTGFSPGPGTPVALGQKIDMVAIQPDPCPVQKFIDVRVFMRAENLPTVQKRAIMRIRPR